jgi:hypothetical protein
MAGEISAPLFSTKPWQPGSPSRWQSQAKPCRGASNRQLDFVQQAASFANDGQTSRSRPSQCAQHDRADKRDSISAALLLPNRETSARAAFNTAACSTVSPSRSRRLGLRIAQLCIQTAEPRLNDAIAITGCQQFCNPQCEAESLKIYSARRNFFAARLHTRLRTDSVTTFWRPCGFERECRTAGGISKSVFVSSALRLLAGES